MYISPGTYASCPFFSEKLAKHESSLCHLILPVIREQRSHRELTPKTLLSHNNVTPLTTLLTANMESFFFFGVKWCVIQFPRQAAP